MAGGRPPRRPTPYGTHVLLSPSAREAIYSMRISGWHLGIQGLEFKVRGQPKSDSWLGATPPAHGAGRRHRRPSAVSLRLRHGLLAASSLFVGRRGQKGAASNSYLAKPGRFGRRHLLLPDAEPKGVGACQRTLGQGKGPACVSAPGSHPLLAGREGLHLGGGASASSMGFDANLFCKGADFSKSSGPWVSRALGDMGRLF